MGLHVKFFTLLLLYLLLAIIDAYYTMTYCCLIDWTTGKHGSEAWSGGSQGSWAWTGDDHCGHIRSRDSIQTNRYSIETFEGH